MKSFCTPFLILCAACSAPVGTGAARTAPASGGDCPPQCCDDASCCTAQAAPIATRAPQAASVAQAGCCATPVGCCDVPAARP